MGIFLTVLQLFLIKPGIKREEQKGPSLIILAKDPYILIACGAMTVCSMTISAVEPTLPLWMIKTMNNPPSWQLGLAFLPASLSYLISTVLLGPIGNKFGRYVATFN
jgi:DHA1 family solute carrier family 18 vesicular amine transporter 1/2